MSSMKNDMRIAEFFRRHGMYAEDLDLSALCDGFIREMEKGLDGEDSSLLMIPTYINAESGIAADRSVIVLDAGGTNLRVALVHFGADKKPVIDYFEKYPMPGTQGEVTREEFYEMVYEYIKPVVDKSDSIGFCFSFPTDILPNRDGRLVHFNKEVKVTGMEGTLVGEGLLEAIRRHGHAGKKSIVIINDTVATLLGAQAEAGGRVFDSYIGFILGTGTNTCYIEENAKIGKLPALTASAGTQIINIESGGYDKAPASDIDDAFDAGTKDPGRQRFEKMISGAYQGGMMLAVLKKAAEEGLFSVETAGAILKLADLPSKAIDDFCYYPYGGNTLAVCCADEADRLTLYGVIDAFFERAAVYVAVSLAAVMRKTGKGTNPCRPVCISAEGTTFYKSKLFKGKLDFYIDSFVKNELGIHCEFMRAENSTITGTAVAGLLD